MKVRIFNRIAAIMVSITLVTALLSGCGKTSSSGNEESPSPSVSSTEIAEIITDVIINETSAEIAGVPSTESASETEDARTEFRISDDWHDYVGNLDTFVYGALQNEYQLAYKTFNAALVLPDDTEVYGIGYTDYSEYYEREDGTGGYFPAGFLALIGEPEIPKEAVDIGLEIVNLDNSDSEYQFVLAYDTKPYWEHCVIWNQYLRYGVDDNQHIVYKTQDYKRGFCEEELGTLYSFDEKRVVFEPNVGNYQNVTGTSLYGSIDYSEIQAEVNRILEEQDYNFATVDVETVLYEAKDAMRSYLLSMQEETFMGCSVKDLLEISKTLDPKECVQFSPEGIVLVDMTSAPPQEPEALTKWLTGICCGTAVATCFAVSIFMPALAPVTASVSGAAVEVFMEVVVQNQNVKNVNWGKVAVAAATGALLAWGCPMLAGHATSGIVKVLGKSLSAEMATSLGKLAGYGILTFSNSVVTGASGAAFTILDGGTKEDAIDAFKLGAAMGAACTVAATLVANGIGAGINKALQEAEPNSWLLKAQGKASSIGKSIGKIQEKVKPFDGKLDSVLIPKSINEAAEAAGLQLKLQQTNDMQLIKRVDQLPSKTNKNFVMTDDSGNVLSKADLRSNGGNGKIQLRDSCDPELREAFAKYRVNEITIKDGVPDFDPISNYKMDLKLTDNRPVNFSNAYDKYLKEWTDDTTKIPEIIQAELDRKGLSIYDAQPNDLASMFSDLHLTIHEEAVSNTGMNITTQFAEEAQEGIDGVVYLVDRTIHSKIGHAGGVAYASAIQKIEIGMVYFEKLHDSVATGITGTLIIEGAQ